MTWLYTLYWVDKCLMCAYYFREYNRIHMYSKGLIGLHFGFMFVDTIFTMFIYLFTKYDKSIYIYINIHNMSILIYMFDTHPLILSGWWQLKYFLIFTPNPWGDDPI